MRNQIDYHRDKTVMDVSVWDAALHILQIICICITVGTVKNPVIDFHEQNSILSAVLVVSDERLRAVRIDGKQARLILQLDRKSVV